MNSRFTNADLYAAKQQGRTIVGVSCYDYTTARLVAQTNIQMVLVGDSAAQGLLGFDSTLPATMDFQVAITSAVRRGAPDACLVADMPFLSYQTSLADALRNAGRFFVESGAQIVKIEAGRADLDVIRAISNAGMAVMAHIGIRPQSISKVGKLRAEATTAEMALGVISLADQVVQAGATSLLIEGVAAEVAQIITERSQVPVIGCGSGPHCDGQILIAPDILGLGGQEVPKFSKRFGELGEAFVAAFSAYADDIEAGRFPDGEHSYHMRAGEFDQLKKLLRERC